MNRSDRREALAALVRQVTQGPGQLTPTVRQAAAERTELPAGLAPLAERIRAGATAVTDDDVARARRDGYNDDQLFELTVATALGESARRLDATLRALGVRSER